MARANKRDLLQAHAEAMRKKNRDKGGGSKKYGRNAKKCARYRQRVGKPNGPSAPGNKH